MQHDEGEATGKGSARVQHAFKVDMNEVAKLQAGEAFIIRQRHAAKVRVARVADVPPAPEEQIRKTDQETIPVTEQKKKAKKIRL